MFLVCPTAGFCVDLSRSVIAATYIYSYGVDIVIRAGETWQYNSGTVHCQEEKCEIIGDIQVVRQQAPMTFMCDQHEYCMAERHLKQVNRGASTTIYMPYC